MSGTEPLRAPARDGEILVVPPLEQVGELLQINRRRLLAPAEPLLGHSWDEVRGLARDELLEAARRYTETPETIPASADRTHTSYRSYKSYDAAPPLFLAGHQPSLFHPGVWVKNFALAGLARRHGGVAVNLIVDNDTLKTPSLRVPVPASSEVPRSHAVTINFDRWLPEVPFEERRVADTELFDHFGERVTEALRGWRYEPIMPGFWQSVRRHIQTSGLIGAAFAAARREIEQQWGCHNLEVPLSVVCASESFAYFAGALLGNLSGLLAAYNGIVRDYRIRNGIRSRHHPVPDLAREGDWLEAPLWGWRSEQTRRGRLFARLQRDRLSLRVGAEDWPDLPAPGRPEFIDAWRDLEEKGYKVRSRALTTTMFARLFLGDLFLHGIGGGKYDELTDELIRRFFHQEPPEFMVLSATRWLPLPAFPVDKDDRRRLQQLLRDIQFNPQRVLSPEQSAALAELLAQRERWIKEQPPDSAGRQRRFAAIRAINAQLSAPLRDEEERVRNELAQVTDQLLSNALLRRRDYAFCLYPESVLRPFCARLT